jgi:hypothetical protein
MALLHQAEITPSKLELISAWAPTQPWFPPGTSAAFANVGAYRLDDPAGEVGIETVFVQNSDGVVLQVPLTYRGAPLVGGERWLITTMQHSVLGERWVYDAVGDPVYLAAVASAALTGGVQAELYVEIDDERVLREPTARVVGNGRHGAATPAVPSIDAVSTRDEGSISIADAGIFSVTVLRQLHTQGSEESVVETADAIETPTAVLSGTWTTQPEPRPLVCVTVVAR